MKQYSKRAFLKLVGLGIIASPFLSLYTACNNPTPDDKEQENETMPTSNQADSTVTPHAITAQDVLLLKREDEKYAIYNEYFNANIQKLPKYIAVCFTNIGIQHAVALANKEKLPIAIKSGGHSFEGFSNNDGGLVINVSNMKSIDWVSPDTVRIEAGCVLQEIHKDLFTKKKLIPAGSCGTVGIAGLTLGGGYGFFSRQYGLTCDQVIDMEYVNAKGEIKLASEDPSLLWALKGGGNGSFGVVSSITFKTHAMPAKFAAHTLKFRKLNFERFETIITQWFDITTVIAEEDFSAFVLNGTTLTILSTTYGDRTKLANILAPLLAMADDHSHSDTPLPTAMKRYYGRKGPLSFKNASAGLYKNLKEIQSVLPLIFETVTKHKGLIYQINTLGGNITDSHFEANSSYPHRSLPYLSELQAYWDKPEQADKLITGFKIIQKAIYDSGITAQYCNYPDIQFQHWAQAYYGNNYELLQKLKQMYDPYNRFQHEQSIQIPNGTAR